MADPGWYQDPEGSGWRWWDGTAWAPQQVAPQVPQPQRSYRMDPAPKSGFWGSMSWSGPGMDSGSIAVERALDASPNTRRISMAIVVLAGTAAVVCALVVLLTVVVGRAVPRAEFLLLVGLPVLVVGQLWGIAILTARQASFRRANPGRSLWRGMPMSVTQGGLSKRSGLLLLSLFYGAVILAFLSILTLSGTGGGIPARDVGGCRYALENHGEVICISESEYNRTAAATQRFGTLILFSFFVGHTGIALGDYLERRPGGVRGGGVGVPAVE